MTLKEKFKSLNTNFGRDTKYYHHNLKKCEKIADDYAIEFFYWTMNWCVEFYDNNEKGNIYKFSNHDNKYTTQEILKIFKKEKGL
jgi:hypothetical protein